jgi:hypothetical protein
MLSWPKLNCYVGGNDVTGSIHVQFDVLYGLDQMIEDNDIT